MREAMDAQVAYESCFHQITDAVRIRIIDTFFHRRGCRKLGTTPLYHLCDTIGKALTSSTQLATRDAQPARGFVVGWSRISRRSVAAADAVAVELLSYNCRVVYECLDLRLVWLLVVLRRHWGSLPVQLLRWLQVVWRRP